jgi:hypothetical protein
VAEYAQAPLADRMRRGRLAKLQRGQLLPWARAPYGYRLALHRTRDPTGVRIKVSEHDFGVGTVTATRDRPEGGEGRNCGKVAMAQAARSKCKRW